MQIWTTTQIAELIPDKWLNIKLFPEEVLKDAFLKNSLAGDVAILNFDADCMDFLSTVKAQGIRGPVIFISHGSTVTTENIHTDNAIILDFKKLGTAKVKNNIDFILKIASEHDGRESRSSYEDPLKIRRILASTLKKEDTFFLVSVQILEDKKPVTVRGVCNIKTIRENTMVLHKFSPTLLLKGLRKGTQIMITLRYMDKNYGAVVSVLTMGGKEICTSIPKRMFTATNRYIRIEPGSKRPINLYLIEKNEPTIPLELINISMRGIGFLSTKNLEVGRSYGFYIKLPYPRAIVVCNGVIKYRKEHGRTIRYGAELEIKPEDEKNIAKYITKRELEIRQLLRNK